MFQQLKQDSLEFYKDYNSQNNVILDPCLTKYEKLRFWQCSQQIENGALLYIPLTDKLTTAYSIALEEIQNKKNYLLSFAVLYPIQKTYIGN